MLFLCVMLCVVSASSSPKVRATSYSWLLDMFVLGLD